MFKFILKYFRKEKPPACEHEYILDFVYEKVKLPEVPTSAWDQMPDMVKLKIIHKQMNPPWIRYPAKVCRYCRKEYVA